MADGFQLRQVFLDLINVEYFMAEAHQGGTLIYYHGKGWECCQSFFC